MGRPRHREAGPPAPVTQQGSQVSIRWNLLSQNLSLPWFPLRTPTHLTTLPTRHGALPAFLNRSSVQLCGWVLTSSVSPFQNEETEATGDETTRGGSRFCSAPGLLQRLDSHTVPGTLERPPIPSPLSWESPTLGLKGMRPVTCSQEYRPRGNIRVRAAADGARSPRGKCAPCVPG